MSKFFKVKKATIEKKADEQNLEQVEQQVYDKIDELDGILYEAIVCCDKIEKMFSQLGIHSADIAPYMTNYLKNFRSGDRNVSVQDMFDRLEEYQSSKE